MNYLSWDVEIIKGEIYLLGYIIYDELFNEIERNIIFNESADFTLKNGKPRVKSINKVNKIKDDAIVVKGFKELNEIFEPILFDENNLSVCYSENDIRKYDTERSKLNLTKTKLQYIDVLRISRAFLPAKDYTLENITKDFNIPHEEPHNPLCDSEATIYLLKYILNKNLIIIEDIKTNLSVINDKKVNHYYEPVKFDMLDIIIKEFQDSKMIHTYNSKFPLENQIICFNKFFIKKHKLQVNKINDIIKKYGGKLTQDPAECTIFIRRETDKTGIYQKIMELNGLGKNIIILSLKQLLIFINMQKSMFFKKIK